MRSNDKIVAIYNLREAVEAKVHAQRELELAPSPARRAALLDATLDLEEKTQTAIEVSHECGHEIPPAEPTLSRARPGAGRPVTVS